MLTSIQLLLLSSVFAFHTAKASEIDSDKIPKGKDGNPIVFSSSSAAEEYCEKIGKKLATFRDLANFAQKNGALGIRNTKFPTNQKGNRAFNDEVNLNLKEGYQPVYTGPNTVGFYYSGTGFDPSNKEFRDQAFWVQESTSGDTFTKVFIGAVGFRVYKLSENPTAAAICL